MDEILDGLLSAAQGAFGPDRLKDLRPTLEAAAAELAALREFPLEPEDVP